MREALRDSRGRNLAWTRQAIAEVAAWFEALSHAPFRGEERDQPVERRARWPTANSPEICEKAKRAQPAERSRSCSKEPRTGNSLPVGTLRKASGVVGDPSPPESHNRP